MYRFFDSLKEIFWRKSAQVSSKSLADQVTGITKKEHLLPLETSDMNMQKLSDEISWLKDKLAKSSPSTSLQYIDQLETIELICRDYETESRIEIKSLEDLFTPEEFLKFKKEFQKIFQDDQLEKTDLVLAYSKK
ncbi:hypothetical protein [Legionella londiniensis]|uniref:Uncharacterized protein n=1 Tax=Legionella londiniensis TaxID=45068 RepID=A0A0W0VM39_9GAMM|nr:hypothetical protein [Legionella londiniensis]KTD21172.1 hypothetical protein Llon_1270 [Legionella londiniensis]STX93196.1 Uncharacterised protein [Legionella londiniensis]